MSTNADRRTALLRLLMPHIGLARTDRGWVYGPDGRRATTALLDAALDAVCDQLLAVQDAAPATGASPNAGAVERALGDLHARLDALTEQHRETRAMTRVTWRRVTRLEEAGQLGRVDVLLRDGPSGPRLTDLFSGHAFPVAGVRSGDAGAAP